MNNFPFSTLDKCTKVHFWVVPDAGSFILTLEFGEYLCNLLFTQWIDLEDILEEDEIPGRIYLNKKLLPLAGKAEKNILLILDDLIRTQQLGHPKGLAVLTVNRILHFFRSEEAITIQLLIS